MFVKWCRSIKSRKEKMGEYGYRGYNNNNKKIEERKVCCKYEIVMTKLDCQKVMSRE
jgi:hypothetical protein